MMSRLRAHLDVLYAPADAAMLAAGLAARIERHRAGRGAGGDAAAPLTERDALLIAYADQLRAPDEAPLATLGHFARARLRGLVSGIHLLPFYPWSSDDGFAVKDFFAVAPEYGTWADVDRLGADFALMFDAVFNHMSAASDWFRRFLAGDPACRDFFVTVEGAPDLSAVVRPRALPLLTAFPTAAGARQVWTTFSADQVDLNFRAPAVLLAAVDALLFYVARGARFIRLDAIAFLWKEAGTSCLHLPQTHRIVQLLRAVLDLAAPGVRLITETNVPHRDNVSYFGDGTNEAQLVYNFALPPLVLHAMQTGQAEKLTRWAQALVLPSDRVTFFNFLASHDGIGLNPARGILSEAEIEALVTRTRERGGTISCKNLPDGSQAPYEMNINYLDALTPPGAAEPVEIVARRFLTAQAMMLCLQGVPGIYLHSLFGSRGDRAEAEATGIKRRINRAKLERAQLEAGLAEANSLRAQVFAGFRSLLEFRRAHAAFAPAATQEVRELDPRVFAVVRESVDGRDRVLALHNVCSEPGGVTVRCPEAGELHLAAHGWRWIPLR